jgi:hypothetical protein
MWARTQAEPFWGVFFASNIFIFLNAYFGLERPHQFAFAYGLTILSSVAGSSPMHEYGGDQTAAVTDHCTTT